MAPGSSPATQFGGKTCLLSACGPDPSAAPGDRGASGRVWTAAGLGLLSPCFPPASQPSTPPGFSAGVAYRIQLLASPIITIFPATRRRGGRALPTPEGLSFLVFTLSHSNLGVPETLRLLTVEFLCCPWGPATPLLHFRVYTWAKLSCPSSPPYLFGVSVKRFPPTILAFAFIFQTLRGRGGISPDSPHSALD